MRHRFELVLSSLAYFSRYSSFFKSENISKAPGACALSICVSAYCHICFSYSDVYLEPAATPLSIRLLYYYITYYITLTDHCVSVWFKDKLKNKFIFACKKNLLCMLKASVKGLARLDSCGSPRYRRWHKFTCSKAESAFVLLCKQASTFVPVMTGGTLSVSLRSGNWY